MTEKRIMRLWSETHVKLCRGPETRLTRSEGSRHLLLATAALLLSMVMVPVSGRAGTITAELEQARMGLGDQTVLILTISGSLDNEIELPAVDGLEFRRSGTSTNVQIVNGSMSKETAYMFEVTPTKAGVFQIPSIQVKIDNESTATAPLTLTVTSAGAPPGAQPGQPNAPPAGAQTPDQEASAQASGVPIVIERELTKSELYDGEAVVSTVRIMHPARLRIASLVPERDPAPDWRIVSKEGQNSYNTTRDGAPWRVTEIQEVLVPLKAGTLAAPTFSLRATYLQPSRRSRRTGTIWDMFGSGMFDMGDEVTKKISTAAKKITVKPLPAEGRPAVVSDMVGDFKLDVDVSKRELAPGETATVTVTVSGRGALDRMADIKVPALIGAKLYRDKPSSKERIDEQGLRSERQIKFAVVPSNAGIIDLGRVELGAFNPATGKWVSLATDLGSLTVSGQGAAAVPAPGESAQSSRPDEQVDKSKAEQSQEATPGAQPTPLPVPQLKTETETAEKGLTPRGWFAIAAAIAGLALITLAVSPLRKRWLSGKRTSSVRSFLGLKPFVAELGRGDSTKIQPALSALRGVIAPQDTNAASMTSADIAAGLRARGVATDIADQVESAVLAVEACQFRDRPLASQEAKLLGDALERLIHVHLS